MNKIYSSYRTETNDQSNIMSSITSLKIKKSTCKIYIPSKENLCGCGRSKEDHEKFAIDNYLKNRSLFPEKWNSKECTTEVYETDSYGEIRFNNNKDLVSKFIRVGQNTSETVMTKLLFSYWKLKRPKLLISVTGGAENFNMKPKLKDVFQKGLIKAALSTNAWITSGGSNVGVMKHVGEAICSVSLNPDKKIVVLGIANWCTVTNNDSLIKKDKSNDNEIFDYNINAPKNSSLKSNPIDPNHSHFILVDNSELNVYGGEIEFRGRLERELVGGAHGEAPVVVLVLEGGANTIQTVLNSVKNDSPCVFIEGSGRSAADIFAYALTKLTIRDEVSKNEILKPLDDDLREDLFHKIQNLWPKKSPEEILKNFEEILEYPHLLTAFRLDQKEKANDIDIAILRSLLKAKKNNYKAQLKLALTWDRVDIAKNFIFTEDKVWDDGSLNNLMYSAIKDDRVDFVDIFLENGCDMNRFLTNRRLLKLYNDIPKSSILYRILIKNKRSKKRNLDLSNVTFKFKDIGEAIEILLKRTFRHSFTDKPFSIINTDQAKKFLNATDEFGNAHRSSDDSKSLNTVKNGSTIDSFCENPNHEMFMYCVLTEKPKMAKIFWTLASNEISSALVASRIFKSYDDELAGDNDYFNQCSLEFEQLAVDILQSSFEASQDDAQLLLLRQIPEFGNSTALQIGASSDDKNFVSTPCYQTLLKKLWYGQINNDTPSLNILTAVILPIFAPMILDLTHDKSKLNLEAISEETKSKQINENISTKSEYEMTSFNPEPEEKIKPDITKISYFKKLYYFFRAPYVKFIYNQIAFILFLGLFSYVILCDYYPIKHINEDEIEIGRDINWPEIALIICVFVFTMDEIRQFIRMNSRFKISQFTEYFTDFWNLVQLGSILLFILSLGLRFSPDMEVYLAARIILSVDILLWFFRSLNGYSFIRSLGPKLVMIRRMINELMIFLLIVIVFIFAYGISSQALMYHNQDLNLDLLKNIFFPAYFVIGGEYFEREKLMEVDECIPDNTSDYLITDRYTQDDCPEEYGTKVNLGLLVVYIIMLNILLVNLLIAIFSNTYEEVQAEADKIWKYQIYNLVNEYFNRPFLPTPFTVIYYAFEIVRFFFNFIIGLCFKINKGKDYNFWFAYLSPSVNNRLRSWENYITQEYMTNEQIKEKESQEFRIQENLNKLENLNGKIDDMYEFRQDIYNKISELDKKMEKIISLLANNEQKSRNVNADESFSSRKLDLRKNSDEELISYRQLKSRNIIEKPKQNLLYPDSNINKIAVPENKKSWMIKYEDYQPSQYTSPDVLFSLIADIDLLNKQEAFRPNLNFNEFDSLNRIDRKSCLGEYPVKNGLPLNPKGRQGIAGRGSLLLWGPNQVYELIFSRYMKNTNGDLVFDENGKRVLEFIALENEDNWSFPSVVQEINLDFTELIERKIVNDLFVLEKMDFKTIMSMIKNPITISKYYKDSPLNTDNAWLEIVLVNFHDQANKIFSKINVKSKFQNKNIVWKEITQEILSSKSIESYHLKRIIKLHQF